MTPVTGRTDRASASSGRGNHAARAGRSTSYLSRTTRGPEAHGDEDRSQILPMSDYVLVERLESVARRGLIVLPEIAQEKNMLGRIVAVGPGKMIEGINGDMVRKSVEARVGELWYFNSKWSDFSPTHLSDDQIASRKMHLVMEADLLLRKNE